MFTKQFQPSLLRAGLLVAVLCCGMATLGSALAAAEPVELIPRDVLFGNPDRLGVQLSPDGRYLSFVAPWEGVLNVMGRFGRQPARSRAGNARSRTRHYYALVDSYGRSSSLRARPRRR